MDDFTTHLIAFLVGTCTGAAGNYFAQKYTDKRRKIEDVASEDCLFAELSERMPDLLGEMRADLSEAEYSEWRDFFVIPKGANLNTSSNSLYYEDDRENMYLSKARTLEEHGYVIDVTPGNAAKFRMTDRFVKLLLKN